MPQVTFSQSVVVFAVNVAAAAIFVAGIAVVAERLMRHSSLPLRYGLLCLGVLLILVSPLLAGLAGHLGYGVVPIPVDLPSDVSTTHLVRTDSDVKRDEQTAWSFGNQQPEPPVPSGSIRSSGLQSGRPADERSKSLLIHNLRTSTLKVGQIAGNLLILVWGAIALWLALRLIHGIWVVFRFRRLLQPTSNQRVIEAGRQAFAAAGVKTHNVISESPLAFAPLTLCWWRPVVVMPQGLAQALNDEELARVLTHEAAHVARNDAAIALLQRLAAAAFWWNPLLHAANRRINLLREWLCDDYVVSQSGDGTTLAEALVRVAEWSAARRAPMPLTLPLLDDGNQLEYRLIRLTEKDPTVSIRLNRRSLAALGVFAFALVVISMAPMLRSESTISKTAAAADSTVGESPSRTESPPESEPANAKKPPQHEGEATAMIHVSGRARDSAGAPVFGAKIYLVSTNGIDKELGTTTTDADGTYEFRDVQLPLRQVPGSDTSGTLQVFGEADGYGFAWHGMRHYLPQPRPLNRPKDAREEFGFFQNETIGMDLTFRPAATLAGSVKDENGRPITNAQIRLLSLDYLDTDERELHPNYREFWAQYFAPSRFCETRTGENGLFQFNGLPVETAGYVIVKHPDFARQSFFAAVTGKTITEYRFISNSSVSIANGELIHTPSWETREVKTSPIDITLNSARRVRIDVVFSDNEAPAKDIRVIASSGDFSTGTHASGMTDERGRVELKLPPGDYRLVADPPRDASYVRTYDGFVVEKEPRDQSKQLRLQPGCILILEAVDAVNDSPIAGVSFWCDLDANGRRGGVQSSTTYVDHPVTNAKGELRAVVAPGTRNYGVGWSPLPNGYQTDRGSGTKLVKCEAGQTIRVKFKLTRP